MPFATQGETRLYWRFDGDPGKPVLLLLNSIGTDLGLWDRALPHLAPQFRLLRMDTRGHGASDVPEGDYTLETLAADVGAVLDAAGVETAFVCGISLGGMIAMTLAIVAPARVRALIPACTSAGMDRAIWTARIALVRGQGMAPVVEPAMQRFFTEDFCRQHPEIVGTARAGLLAMNPAGYAGCGAAIRDMAILDRLGAIAVPTLLIAGTKDVSTPFAGHGERIAAAIPHAKIAMLDAAHLACIEAPAAFAAEVRRFAKDMVEGPAEKTAADAAFESGLEIRRAVLGDEWVEKSLKNRTPFNADFQAMITRFAWNEIWGRPGLDHRTRRLLVLAITAALGRREEFRLHVKAGLQQGGFTEDELKETLMQTAVYAGIPAGNTAFADAARVIADLKRD